MLLAWASPQHCSPVRVLPPLIHQQTRPTRQAPMSPSTGGERPRQDPGAGRARMGTPGVYCVHLPSAPPAPCPGQPGEAELRSHAPARAGSIGRSSCGRPRGARGEGRAPQMGTRGCVSASRAPVPGSPGWRLCGFAVLCPSPSRTACRIWGLCKRPPPGLPPPAPPLPGGPGHGEPRALHPPVLHHHPGHHPPARPAPRRAELQPSPRQKAQGMLTRPVSATCPQPGRDGSAGEAPPFCPRASLLAHPVDLSQAQRGAELP